MENVAGDGVFISAFKFINVIQVIILKHTHLRAENPVSVVYVGVKSLIHYKKDLKMTNNQRNT